jgi:hypothetical protein
MKLSRSEASRLETARVKAEDELEWWKLENGTGDAEQKPLPKTLDSCREDDPRI